MMSDELRELAHLTRMNQVSRSKPDWEAVKTSLGFDVPEDYKQLINLYGTGAFGNYIQIFGPEETQQAFNLKHQGLYWTSFLKKTGGNIALTISLPHYKGVILQS